METTKTADIKPLLNKMVSEGRYEAKFGQLINAKYFVKLLESKSIQSRVDTIMGHATTVDTHPSVRLSKHFHVEGLTNTAHQVLKKFV
jgi:hypothetical protein